jgi:hypothetical protein
VAGLLYAINPRLVYSTSFVLIIVMVLVNLVFLPRRASDSPAPVAQSLAPSPAESDTSR